MSTISIDLEEQSWPVALSLARHALTFSGVFLCTIVAYLVFIAWEQSKSYKHLRHAPGKKEAVPFLNFYVYNKALSKNSGLVDYNVQLFNSAIGSSVIYRKHGYNLYYIGSSPYLFIYNCKIAEALLSNNELLDKANDYDFLHPWLGTGLLTSTGTKWRSRRKMLSPAFHFRILEDFLPVMNEQAVIFSQKMCGMSVEKWVNVLPQVTFCTLDIICETVMGAKINAQLDSESSYVQAIATLGELFIKRSQTPFLWPDFVFNISAHGKTFYQCLDILHGFTRKVIKDRKKELLENPEKYFSEKNDDSDIRSKHRRPFLDLLLLNHIKNPELTEEDIREEVDTFMFEGHDTTAMGISWSLYLIGCYPEIQRKLQEEMDGIFGDDKTRPVTPEDLRSMKYLECALKESQRLFPSVPIIGRKTKVDMKLKDMTVPKGTSLQLFIYALHRDPEQFPKPEEYDPDRFLPENTVGRHPFAYVPFSAGPRNCIGQKFAMMEEKVVVSTILRNFNLVSIEPRDKLLITGEMVIRPKNGLKVKFIPRE